MALKITGKNVDIGQALRGRIEAAVPGLVAKYFNGGYSAHVTVAKSGRSFETDCALHLDSGMVFEARGLAPDAHASFDQAAERLEKRLRRYKRRLKDYAKPTPMAAPGRDIADFVLAPPAEEEELGEDYAPVIVAETRTAIPTLTVSAAVMQLDRTDAALVVFRNQSHGEINVVYRRPDGHFGWIDPALSVGKSTAA